jgi:hypothetical protein
LSERLPPTDLQSLLLEVARRRAAQQTPAGLLARYERDRFVRPSTTSPEALGAFDRLAFSLAVPTFEPLELSPVCPLGTNSVVAGISQHLAVATVRNTEVVSDSTNVLALECAVRRRALRRADPQSIARVQLCASHRLLRAQRYDQPGLLAHFRAFVLCTAGRDEGARRFELSALADHLRFYLRLMAAAGSLGFLMANPRVALTTFPGATATMSVERLESAVLAPLAADFPQVRLGLDPERQSGRAYYDGLCFKVYATDPTGSEREVGDGGLTTWTRALLGDHKERLLISAIGTERVCSLFATLGQ